MPFIKEEVSSEDIEKYGLRAINRKFRREEDETYEWIVDKDRDVYLREMAMNWQNPSEMQFSFHWKGHLFELPLTRDAERVDGGKRLVTWQLRGSTAAFQALPAELKPHQDQLISDLKAVLAAYDDMDLDSASPADQPKFRF